MNNLPSGISMGFWILWISVFLVLIALYASVIRKNLQRRRAPMASVQAVLVTLEKGKRPLSAYRGVFETSEGKTLKLFIAPAKAKSLSAGSRGRLFYKGNTFVSLDAPRREV